MKKLSGLKTVAAIATFVAATAISTSALANPFNPFEALFGPHREPVAAPAYANPVDDGAQRSEFRRYGIGVGREGFAWSGTKTVERKAEWPDWTPPPEMIQRQPYLPRFVAGGETNPLGARALYLGGSVYRIHGTNAPDTIGGRVSSGCIRMVNEDVIDLYSRVKVGTKVVVKPIGDHRAASAASGVN